MIKYLRRMKNKKGFTIVELVVVVAIIAVLIAIIMVNMIGGNTDKQLSASSNAHSFFSAVQLTATRAQLTERSIVTYADSDVKYIEYANGVNVIKGRGGKTDNYLFLEAKFAQNGIVGLHISDTFEDLMSKDDPSAAMTALESYIAQNLDEYLTESYDGYFYAVIDNSFKVMYAHYCDDRLPQRTSYATASDFRNAMMIDSSGKVSGNSDILGTWSDDYIIPATGDYVFSLPSSTDTANYSFYFD